MEASLNVSVFLGRNVSFIYSILALITVNDKAMPYAKEILFTGCQHFVCVCWFFISIFIRRNKYEGDYYRPCQGISGFLFKSIITDIAYRLTYICRLGWLMFFIRNK